MTAKTGALKTPTGERAERVAVPDLRVRRGQPDAAVQVPALRRLARQVRRQGRDRRGRVDASQGRRSKSAPRLRRRLRRDFSATRPRRREPLLQVLDQVGRLLDADREPHQPVADADRLPLARASARDARRRPGRASASAGRRASGPARPAVSASMNRPTRDAVAVAQVERQHRAEPPAEQPRGQLVLGVVRQARVVDPLDAGLLAEPSRRRRARCRTGGPSATTAS